jgi:diadenylate cyclase
VFQIEFLRIGVVDLIDIAIVAFVLYRLYASMRGTIAAQIFVGLVLILAVSVVSQFLEMRLLSWLLRTVGDIWVIALIILFQPELRRILLVLGRQGFGSNRNDVSVEDVVNPLVEGVTELSRRRFGALIVVAQATDISFTFDTGVPVGADLSREMLITIFNPKSPLHDGAVVVSGDRIETAGVILPFSSEVTSHDERLGTRHRAGLGISEQADVLVLIVSEETGHISYAKEGRLYYNKSTDEIRSVLGQALAADKVRKEQPLFRRLFGIGRRQKPGTKH